MWRFEDAATPIEGNQNNIHRTLENKTFKRIGTHFFFFFAQNTQSISQAVILTT